MRLYIIVGLIFLPLGAWAQTGPGGIGTTDGSSNLILWLSTTDMQENGFIQGDGINRWADLSGNNSDATITGNPDFTTGVLNSHPAVRFASVNSEFLEGALSGNAVAPLTLIAVGRFTTDGPDATYGKYLVGLGGGTLSQASISKEGSPSNRYYSFDGSARSVGPVVNNDWHIFLSMHNTTTPYHRFFLDNVAQAIANNYSSPFNGNTNFNLGRNASGNAVTYLDGDLTEIILINRLLNSAERNIICNYLSSKFNLTVTNDLFAGDADGSGNYDLNVAGVGTEADGAKLEAGSAGLSINQQSGFGNGDYILFGHRSVLNSVNTFDVTEATNSIQGRWSRTWFIDVTDAGTAATSNVSFDFSEAGFAEVTGSAASYRLIRYNGTGWDLVSTANSVVGDRITFNNVILTDGIYTLASVDLVTGGLSTQALTFGDGPAGIGSTNGTGGLLLWVDASSITGVANGSDINSWPDLVQNDQSPVQNIGTLQPNLLTNQQNGLPVVRFDGIDDFMQGTFGNLDAPLTIAAVGRFNQTNQGAFDNDYIFDLGAGSLLLNNPGTRASISRRMNNDAPIRTNRFYTFAGDAFHYGPEISGGQFHAFTSVYQTSAPFHQLFLDGVNSSTAPGNTRLNTNGVFQLGRLIDQTDDYFLNGDIAELMVYNVALNSAQSIVLQNSLAAKWGLTLSSDYYQGDTPANGDHDFAVSGVGRAHDGDMQTGQSGGLTITLSPNAQPGYVIFGHGLQNNAINTTDVTAVAGVITQRIARTWYLSFFGTPGSPHDLVFDYSDMGISGTPPGIAANYGLIFRPALTGDWTIVATATALSGDQVFFDNVNITLTGSGFYTLASLNGAVLPVTLASFKASVLSEGARKQVYLNWATASERDSKSFTIQRSAKGKEWTSLSTIHSHGNSITKKEYSYIDPDPLLGRSYYRLVETDIDLSSRPVGHVETVFITPGKPSLQIFPNPSKNSFHLHTSKKIDSEVNITISNLTGKIVYRQTLVTADAEISPDLSDGIYVLTAEGSGIEREVIRIVVRK